MRIAMSDSLISSFAIAAILLCDSFERGLDGAFAIGVLGRQDMLDEG
jgi:hypothetical protein